MAVTLKLARHGAKGVPYYRIVVSEKGSKRDGRFIEKVGVYNPMVNPPVIKFTEERLKHWVSVGAQTTEVVRRLIIKAFPGLIEQREEAKLKKVQAARRARKERAKNAASGKSASGKKAASKKKSA